MRLGRVRCTRRCLVEGWSSRAETEVSQRDSLAPWWPKNSLPTPDTDCSIWGWVSIFELGVGCCLLVDRLMVVDATEVVPLGSLKLVSLIIQVVLLVLLFGAEVTVQLLDLSVDCWFRLGRCHRRVELVGWVS